MYMLPEKVLRRLLDEKKCVKIAALGSSNTQRRLMGMHWFDFIELGCKAQFGKGSVLCCNMGVGGETSRDLLARFDRDCGSFAPHIAIITCGGNDSHFQHDMTEKEFYDNMCELHRRFTALGTTVFFQTYYACDLEYLESEYAVKLVKFMQIVRDVAADCDAYVQDNFQRWNALYTSDLLLYRTLMTDRLHVNEHGNALLGLDWLRTLDVEANAMIRSQAQSGLFAQKVLDLLNK